MKNESAFRRFLSKTLIRILDEMEYTVRLYLNGDAVFKGDVEVPDLFILDKQIAGTDGIEICRFVKKDPQTKDVPVIMFSASPHVKTLAMKTGADVFLEKPFSLKTFREEVSRLLSLQ